jgi:hypothetical protein
VTGARFVSEPCLWFRNPQLPRSPSDNIASMVSESHPDFDLLTRSDLDQV